MKATSKKRDWNAEQRAFLAEIDVAEHFLRLFEGFPDVYVFVKNHAGETLFCSARLPFNHGFTSAAEMLGKTDHELTPGPLAEKYLADDARIYHTGKPLPPQIEICMDSIGLPDWYRTCKYPVTNRQGEVIGIMGTFQLVGTNHTPDMASSSLEPARQMIQQDLLSFPDLNRLAACCGMSTRNFQRLFKKTWSTSPRTYWLKLRIRAACQKLVATDLSLSQISSDLGFFDQSSFTKHFCRHTGQTPAQYRNQRR